MTALITSSELGLFGANQLSSHNNQLGYQTIGQRLNDVSINLATGNLAVRRQDQLAMAKGVDSQLLQTYNSLGQQGDGTNWWLGAGRNLQSIPSVDKAGSQITRFNGDGSESQYHYDAQLALYVGTDGSGTHNTFERLSNNTWVWRNEKNQQESYDSQGRLLSIDDGQGNFKNYRYQNNRLTSIEDASGQTTWIDYISHTKGDRINAIRTTATEQGQLVTRTDARYTYDSLGRLTLVRYDLSPDDNRITDGRIFSLRYSYDQNSQRIATVSSSDGSFSRFTYEKYIGRNTELITKGSWLVASMTDAEGRQLTFNYDTASRTTNMLDEYGQTTSYRFDVNGQLLSVSTPPVEGTRLTTFFTYDDQGNLTSKKNSNNEITHYQYDKSGNLLQIIDAKGSRIDRQYNDSNKLITEIRYTDFDIDGIGAGSPEKPTVTRHLYNDNNQLRFSVSGSGEVIEMRYNTAGQVKETRQYSKNTYDVSSLTPNSKLDLALLNAWVAIQTENTIQRQEMKYDFRGQLQRIDNIKQGLVSSSKQFVYDYAGRLLSQVNGEQEASHYNYDGLGRLTRSQNGLGEITLTTHDDRAHQVITQFANGRVNTEIRNRVGDIIERFDAVSNGVKQNRERFIYDDLGRLRIKESATGAKEYFFYDQVNRKIGQIDEFAQLTTWRYNANGQVIATTQYSDRVNAQQLASSSGGLNEALWNLNAFTQKASGFNDIKKYRVYDSSGLQRFSINGEGYVTEQTYDALGKLIHKATYEKKLDTNKLDAQVTENKIIALLYNQPLASVSNEVITEGRDPIQPYSYVNKAQLQQRFTDSQLIGIQKTGGYTGRIPNQPYVYSANSDSFQFIKKDSITTVEQIRLADGRQALTWEPKGHIWPKVELGYRILHNNDQYEYLPVSLKDGKYYVELPSLERSDYEVSFFYKDEYNQTRTESRGALTVLTSPNANKTTLNVLNYESYWLAKTAVGSSLGRAIPSDQYANLEKVTATVYKTPSQTVRSDLNNLDFITQADTLAEAYPSYQGQVNLSQGKALSSGRYQLHLTMHHKDGSTTEIAPFLYEIGEQSTGTLSQKLTWPLSTFANESGSVHQARYRTSYRNTDWITVPVNIIDGQYQVKLDKLTAGEYYEVELVHQQGNKNFLGEVENRKSSTFLFQANDQDTPIAARSFQRTISDIEVAGSSITGVYNNAQMNTIDYVLADVFDNTTGKRIASAYTYTSAYSDYTGQINLSTEQALKNGDYRVELRAYHRNGTTSTKNFAYEIGEQQTTSRPTIVKTVLANLPDNADVYYFFPQLNGARYVQATVGSNKEVSILVNDLYTYDTRKIPDGLFDMFVQYRDKTNGRILSRHFTHIKIDSESHDTVLTNFDEAPIPPKGFHQQYYYDVEGRLTGEIDKLGAVKQYSYDQAGNLIKQTNYANLSGYGDVQSFDSLEEILARFSTSNKDQNTHYLYDQQGQKTAQVNAEGYVTTYNYDNAGRIVGQTKYQQSVTYTGQNLNELSALVNYQNAQQSSYEYDKLGRLVKEQNHQGLVTTTSYNNNGQIESKSQQDINRGDFQHGNTRKYDAFGRITAELDAIYSEQLRKVTTNVQKQAIWEKHAVHYQYDKAGLMIHSYQNHDSVMDQSSGQLSNQQAKNWLYYGTAGNLIYLVDNDGGVTKNTYDAFNRKIASTQYEKAISTSGLTGGTALKQIENRLITSQNDITNQQAYDKLGRLVEETNTRGTSTQFSYNAYNQLATRFVPNAISSAIGQKINYQYNGIGQLTETVVYADGKVTKSGQAYDAFGRVIWSKAVNGVELEQSYDRLGQRTQTKNSQGNSQTSSYDAFGRLLSMTDALGQTTNYRYMNNKKGLTLTYPDGVSVQKTFDSFGNTLEIIDGKGHKKQYEYDELGRQTTVTSYNAKNQLLNTEKLAYNSQGVLAESTNGQGSITRYYYDAKKQLLERIQDAQGEKLSTRYQYDTLGRKIETHFNDGQKTELTYDQYGQLRQQIQHGDRNKKIVTFYEHDDRGNQTRMIASDQTGAELLVTEYRYDNLNRLIEKREDPTGINRLTEYQYDHKNNLIHSAISGGKETYQVFDEFGLGQLRFSISGSGIVTEYQYDANGQKTVSVEYARTIATQGLLTALTSHSEPRVEIQQRLAQRPLYNPNDEGPQGQLTELNDVTRHFYDNRGRVQFTLDSTGYLSEFFYDANGNEISQQHYKEPILLSVDQPTKQNITDFLAINNELESRVERNVYDGLNRLVLAIDSNNIVTRYNHNGTNQIVSTHQYKNPVQLGNIPLSTALTEQAVVTSNSANDQLSQTIYDGLGRVEYMINGEGYVTQFQYDGLGKITDTYKFATAVTIKTYTNEASLRSQLNNSDAQHSRSWFDKLGRQSYQLNSQGFLTAYTYDGLGRMTRSERTSVAVNVPANANANRVKLSFIQVPSADKANNLIENNRYDSLGRLVAQNNGRGQEQTFAYDSSGKQLYSQNISGHRTYFSYDIEGRVIRKLIPINETEGRLISYHYNDKGLIEKETSYMNPVGLKTPNGAYVNAEQVTPVANNQVDGDRVVHYRYDSQGRVISKTIELNSGNGTFNPERLVTEYSYNYLSQLSEEIKASGSEQERRTQFTYDSEGQLIRETKAAGSESEIVREYRYDAFGNQTHIIDPRGIELAEKDSDWALTQRIELGWVINTPIGSRAKFASELSTEQVEIAKLQFSEITQYDEKNQVIAVTNATGETIRSEYNAYGDLVKHTDGAGNESIMVYDNQHQVRFAIDALGAVTEFTYTARGEIKTQSRYQVTLTSGSFSTNSSLSNLTSLVAARPQQSSLTTTHFYNNLGQVTQTQDALGFSEYYQYDSVGNVTQMTDKLGFKVVNVYDAANRLIESRSPSVNIVTNASSRTTSNVEIVTRYSYDVLGQRIEVIQAADTASAVKTQYQYDQLGREINVIHESKLVARGNNGAQKRETPTQNKTYDLAGNLLTTQDNLGLLDVKRYDAVNRVISWVDKSDLLHTYVYDAAGNRIIERTFENKVSNKQNITDLQNAIDTGKYHEIRYHYDSKNRLISQSSESNIYYSASKGFTQSEGSTQVIYNNAGQEAISIDGKGVAQYTYYNEVGNAVLTINGDGFVSKRDYDANGNNIKEVVYADQLTAIQLKTLSANSSVTQVQSLIGPAADDRTTYFKYDGLNRLIEQSVKSVRYSTTSRSNVTESTADFVSRFQYDANNNLVLSEVGGLNNDKWVGEKNQVTFEYDSLNRKIQQTENSFTNYQRKQVTPTTFLAYDIHGNQVLTVKDAEQGSVGQIDMSDRITTRYVDKFGRVTRMTGPNGVEFRYVYDQYDNIIVSREKQTYKYYNEYSKTISNRTRWLVDKYSYNEKNQQILHLDAAGVQHQTRYNSKGQLVARGTMGFEHDFFEYDNSGRMIFSDNQGKQQRFFYDESGNATLAVSSTGANLQNKSVAWLLSADRIEDGFHFSINRYDGRNNGIETINPELDFLRAQAKSAPVIGQTPASNYSQGKADVAMGGDINVKFHLMSSGSKKRAPEQVFKQYGVSFNFTGFDDYQGKLRLVWDTGFAGKATQGESVVDLAKKNAHFHGIRAGSEHIANNKSSFERFGVVANGKTTSSNITKRGFVYDIKTYKQNAEGEWVFYKTLKGSYGWEGSAPDIDKYHARSRPNDAHSLATLVTLADQPAAATRVSVYYRANGTQNAFNTRVAHFDNNGKFNLDFSDLADGKYEYYYHSSDAAGKIINGAKGVITLGAKPTITHINTAKEQQSLQSLEQLAEQSLIELRRYGIDKSQSYNAFGQLEQTIDGKGNKTNYEYDNRGQLIKRTDPTTWVTNEQGKSIRQAAQTKYQFDIQGNQVSETDANNNKTVRSYITGKVSSVYYADGASQTFTYDIYGQLRNERSKDRKLIRYSYDNAGNVITVDRLGRNDDTYIYDQQGQQISHSTGYKNVNTGGTNVEYFIYDRLGRVINNIDMAGNQTDYTYNYVTGLGDHGGWQKITNLSNGDSKEEHYDHAQRLIWKKDLGGHTFAYQYDSASGLLTGQTGSTGQNIHYSYYSNGLRKQIDDLGANNNATFSYDANGNMTQEDYYYYGLGGETKYSQQSNVEFDELNRMISFTDTGVEIRYEYDAVGNRRRIQSDFTQVNGNSQSIDHWYTYDNANRVSISKGDLTNSEIVRGGGIEISYDSAGRRKTVTNAGGSVEKYTYNAFGWLVKMDVDGNKRMERSYFDGGYLKSVKEYRPTEAPVLKHHHPRAGQGGEYFEREISEPYWHYPNGNRGQLASEVSYTYNASGQKNREESKRYNNSSTNDQNSTTTYVIDSTGNTLKSQVSTSSYAEGEWTTSSQTTRFTFEKWDNYKQSKIEVAGSVGDKLRYSWDKGLSELVYDVNGNVLQAKDNYGGRLLSYINSYDGKVLIRTEETPSYTKNHQYFYYQGIGIGDIGDDGASYRDYASVLSQAQRKQSSKEAEYKPVMAADFDANFVPVSRQSGVASGRYTVNRGDTLMSIATNLWGDRSLWYLIADANGLKGTEKLTSGTTLTLPNVSTTNLHNSSSTFRPYNGGAALGDINPTLPEVPPPPIPPEPKAGGCGGVAMIVMVVVAVVATVVTAGAAAAAIPGLVSAGTSVWAAGMGVMAGTYGFGVGVAAAAFAGGFVGSVASQLVGKAMGVVDSFSLRKAVAGGFTSVATVGIGSALKGFDALAKGTELTRTGRILQAAISVPANVGTNELAGIDTSFSWGNVAVSVLSAAAMTSNAMKGFLGSFSAAESTTAEFSWGNVANETGAGIVGAGVSYGVGKAILKGDDRPSWNFKQVAFSAFGNAVGSEINRSRGRAGQIEQEKHATEQAVKRAAVLDDISKKVSIKANNSIDEIQRRTGDRIMQKISEEVTEKAQEKMNTLSKENSQVQEAEWEKKQIQRDEQKLADIEDSNQKVAAHKAKVDVLTLGMTTQLANINTSGQASFDAGVARGEAMYQAGVRNREKVGGSNGNNQTYIPSMDNIEIPALIGHVLGGASRLADISQKIGTTTRKSVELYQAYDEYGQQVNAYARNDYKNIGMKGRLWGQLPLNGPDFRVTDLAHSSIYGPDGSEMVRIYGEEMTSSESTRLLNETSNLYQTSKYLGHAGDLLEVGIDTYNNFTQDGVSSRAFIASALDTGQVFFSGYVSTIAGTFTGTIAGAATAATFFGAPVAPAVALSVGVGTGVAVDYGIDSVYDNVFREPLINMATYTYDGVKSAYGAVYQFASDFGD